MVDDGYFSEEDAANTVRKVADALAKNKTLTSVDLRGEFGT